AVSAIEMALWDLAGKAAGLPVHRLLGGKIRDRVRVYNGALRKPLAGQTPKHYADEMKRMRALPEGFTIVKQGIAFHSPIDRGLLTERGLAHILECVEAMKEVLGNEVGLALDCGPGWTVPDAIRFARAVEHLNLMWLEDMITGDYTPYVDADVYRDV